MEWDDLEVAKLLLKKGADPNKSGSLLRALSMGQTEMIRLFVEKGADFKTDPRLLVYAAASGGKEVVELVLAKSGVVLTDAENRGMRPCSTPRSTGRPTWSASCSGRGSIPTSSVNITPR